MTRYFQTAIIILVSLLLLTNSGISARNFKFQSTHEYHLDDGFNLNIDNVSGDIEIIHRAGEKVVVQIIKNIEASSREEAEELEEELDVIIEHGNNLLEIETRYPKWRRGDGFWEKLFDIRKSSIGNVKYIIETPYGTDIDITTTSGDVSIQGITGSLKVESTSGDIEVNNYEGFVTIVNTSGNIMMKNLKGNIDVRSTSSDSYFDSIEGNLDLKLTSGDTEIYYLDGNLQLNKTSGEVLLKNCSGDFDIKTSSGDIFINQDEGSLFVETVSGDINIHSQLRNGRRYEIETVSGDISFEVPIEMNGKIELRTTSGQISTDLAMKIHSYEKNRLEGRIGRGGPDLILTSISGDVSLEEY